MSEIYQHLVVQIEMTRIEYLCPLIPEATFLTISVFPGHWLVVLYNLCHLIYIYIFHIIYMLYLQLCVPRMLLLPAPQMVAVVRSVSEGENLERVFI